HDTPAGEQLLRHRLGQRIPVVDGRGVGQERPPALTALTPRRGPAPSQGTLATVTSPAVLAPAPHLPGRQERPDRLEAASGDQTPRHQVPQTLLDLDGQSPGEG